MPTGKVGLCVCSNVLVTRWIIAFMFCFYLPQKRGKSAAFLPLPKSFFYNTSKPDLKESAKFVIKLSDLSSKSKSLQARCYLDRGGSLSNAYL